MVLLLDELVGVFFLFIGSIAAISGLLIHFTGNDDDARRGLGEKLESSAILGFNRTNLRGQDVASLQGMRIDMIAANAAMVTTEEFSVKANVMMHRDHSSDGMTHGGLSFLIPGLDTPLEGTFVSINETAANDKTKADFQKVHALLQQQHKGHKEVSLEEAIASIAKAT